MSRQLFVVAGHGAGDPGGVGNGYKEADLTRKLAAAIKKHGGSNVVVGDTTKNWYRSKLFRTYNFNDAMVLELHLDAAGASSARGGHVIIHSAYSPDKYDVALEKVVSSRFPGRAKTLVKRSDLYNINMARTRKINYRLLECCFITNKIDVDRFISELDEFAMDILEAFDIPHGETVEKPIAAPAPVATAPQKNISQMADEILAGRHGNGHPARRSSLNISAAEYEKVRAEVNARLGGKKSTGGKTVDQMAHEVIIGKHGNGHDSRRKSLGVSASVYAKVRKRVNQLAK